MHQSLALVDKYLVSPCQQLSLGVESGRIVAADILLSAWSQKCRTTLSTRRKGCLGIAFVFSLEEPLYPTNRSVIRSRFGLNDWSQRRRCCLGVPGAKSPLLL